MVPATVFVTQRRCQPANHCRRYGWSWLPLFAAGGLMLSGCTTLSGVIASKMFTAAGFVSLAATGRGLADHALTLVMREDCRILDGVLREDREICEQQGSPATDSDFKGLLAFLNDDDEDPGLSQTYRFDQNDELALELSNMTGRSAGDQPGDQPLRFQPVSYQLQLETRLPGRSRHPLEPYLLAGLTQRL